MPQEFFVLYRTGEHTIVSVAAGDYALDGHESWEYESGPHASWADAWDAMVEAYQQGH